METSAEEALKDGKESVLSNNSTTEKVPTQDTSKKSKKESRSSREDKSIEHFMKNLNSVPLEEKASLLCKKYVQLAEDNNKMKYHIKQTERLYNTVSKEKEMLQLEYNKNVLLKSKLENLCRELQKQNRAIKEESLLKLREEEERRKETQAKFQTTLSEISALLQQNNEKNAQLRDDNISMSEKFKSVVQQYQNREEQVDKLAKQMALEAQLADAKMAKASLEHQAERERLLAELDHIKATMGQYRAKIAELQGTEENLRSQLAIYTDKYNEFQSALTRSNQFYGGFKEQMEMMSKKIKKLEKESLSWKQRWEGSQTALIDMCGERQASEERAASVARQLAHMQSLCRTLQAERTLLLNTLKENNIERPPLPSPPPPVVVPIAAPPTAASNAKVDAMAANCAQLKQNLAQLQTQLNVLTSNQQKNATAEPPKQEKPKKSKSKKNKDKKNQEKVDALSTDSVKERSEEIHPTVKEDKVEKDPDSLTDMVNDKTLENLIEAIHSANKNLCELEIDEADFEMTDNVTNDVVNEVLDVKNAKGDLKNEEKQSIVDEINETEETQSLVKEINKTEEKQSLVAETNKTEEKQVLVADINKTEEKQSLVADNNKTEGKLSLDEQINKTEESQSLCAEINKTQEKQLVVKEINKIEEKQCLVEVINNTEENQSLYEKGNKTEKLADDVSVTANNDCNDIKVNNVIEVNDKVEIINLVEESNVTKTGETKTANTEKKENSKVDTISNEIST